MAEPCIHVRFVVAEDAIQEVMLLPSPTFQWSVEGDHSGIDKVIKRWLDSYLSKKEPKVQLPLCLDFLPPFTKKALEQLRTIPFSQLTSYRELAIKLRNPNGARAVGNACGRNPFPLIIPCHRVIASNQKIGGFSQSPEIKRLLLAFEGHAF